MSTEEAQDVEDGTDEYVKIIAFKGSSIRSRRRARLGLPIKVHNVGVLGRGAGQRPPLCAKMRLSARDDKVLHAHREQEGWSPGKLQPDDLRAERDPSRF